MTWLDRQIEKLCDVSSKFSYEIKKIKEIQSDVYNEFEEATPLKLIFLHYSLSIYALIISKYYKNMFYIDLFAGSGLNKMKNSRDTIIGSPLIALLNHRERFTHFFFCEKDPMLFDALKLRLEALSIKNVEIIHDDCNTELDNIISKIKEIRSSHAFFFIDPYAMEFKWNSMKKVLSTYTDVMFTFMTHNLTRARNSALAQPKNSTIALDDFFGDKSWASDSKDALVVYKQNILKVRKNAEIESVNINGYYDIIFITNKTKGKNPWMNAIREAKKEIEKMTPEQVKTALDKLNRGQKELFDY